MEKIFDVIDSYCVLDTETTGFSVKYDEIIEIGIIKVENNEVVDTFNQLLSIDFPIDEFVTKHTGITNEMLQGKPRFEDIKESFLNFIGDSVLVGHNLIFDFHFLNRNLGYNLENKYIDTLLLSRRLFPGMSHYRLSDMQSLLNLSKNTHRSIADCITTKELYDYCKNKITSEGLDLKAIHKKHSVSKHIDISSIKPEEVEIDENNFFYGKHCVFTGTLERMVRKDAMQLVVNLGGILDNSVTKNTNYLILGNNDYRKTIKDGKSSKHKKAEANKLKGQDIEIIDEYTFYQLLNQ